MKVPSSLLKALLITATLGVTATGCKTMQPTNVIDESGNEKSIIQTVKQLFQRQGGPESCPACGMG